MPFNKRTTALFDHQLDQLTTKVVAAAELVVQLIENPEKASELAKIVGDLEHACDRIVRETTALQTASLGSVERGDLMSLLERVDDIIDVADSLAERVWLHQVGAPTAEAKALAQVFLEASRKVRDLIGQLRVQRQPLEILEHCVEINKLEQKGDELYRSAILTLFNGKQDALHVIRWKEVYERLERGINKCEDVSRLVEGLVQAIA